jgi:hypothetical protein
MKLVMAAKNVLAFLAADALLTFYLIFVFYSTTFRRNLNIFVESLSCGRGFIVFSVERS